MKKCAVLVCGLFFHCNGVVGVHIFPKVPKEQANIIAEIDDVPRAVSHEKMGRVFTSVALGLSGTFIYLQAKNLLKEAELIQYFVNLYNRHCNVKSDVLYTAYAEERDVWRKIYNGYGNLHDLYQEKTEDFKIIEGKTPPNRLGSPVRLVTEDDTHNLLKRASQQERDSVAVRAIAVGMYALGLHVLYPVIKPYLPKWSCGFFQKEKAS